MFGRKQRRSAEAEEITLLARGFTVAYGPDAGLAAESRLYASQAAERRVLQAVVQQLSQATAAPS